MEHARRQSLKARPLKVVVALGLFLIISFSLVTGGLSLQRHLSYAVAPQGSLALGMAHVAYDWQNLSFVTSLDHTYDLNWSDDQYLSNGNLHDYDHEYEYQVANGNDINLLGNMFTNGTACYSLASWDNYVLNTMNNYTAIHSWEIGQEYPFLYGDEICPPSTPYAFSMYGGNFSESASSYVKLLESAYDTIKANDPNATVHCLVSDLFGAGYPIPNSTTWSNDVWADGAGNYCDIVDLHEYSTPFLMNQTNTQVYPHESEITLVNDTLSQYENLTGKPIWISETGYESQGSTTLDNGTVITFTPQWQAEGLQQEYNLYLSLPYIKGVFWYQVMDDNYTTCTTDCYFGLFDDQGNAKPALTVWESFNNGTISTTTTLTSDSTSTVTSTTTITSTNTTTSTVTSTVTTTSTVTSTTKSVSTKTSTSTTTVTSTTTSPTTTTETTTVTSTVTDTSPTTTTTTETTTDTSTATTTSPTTTTETQTTTVTSTSTTTSSSTVTTTATSTSTITNTNTSTSTLTSTSTVTSTDSTTSSTTPTTVTSQTQTSTSATTTSYYTGFLGMDQKRLTGITFGSATSVAFFGIGFLGIVFSMKRKETNSSGSWRW